MGEIPPEALKPGLSLTVIRRTSCVCVRRFPMEILRFSPLADEHVPREICRDVPAEFYISRLITRYFSYWEDESGELVIRGDEEALYQVLSEGMPQFQEVGEVWLSESVRHLRVLPPPEVSMGVSLGGGWLDLKIETAGIDPAELLQVLSEYRQKRNITA